jgi:hypothetical protein
VLLPVIPPNGGVVAKTVRRVSRAVKKKRR